MSRILITGASKGIGRAIASELAARGHDVIATARDPRTLTDLPVGLRLPLDVTDQRSVDAAVDAAGPVDVLLSNAGEIFLASVEDSPADEIERLFAVNTFGAIRVARAVLPAMRERGSGNLVFMSSAVGRVTLPLIGTYAATKWALECFAETLAIEVRRFGVHVQLLEPGSVASGALDAPLVHPGTGLYAALAGQVSLGDSMLSVGAVAAATADAIEADEHPLRVPIGDAAEQLVGLGRRWPADRPFEPAPFDW